MALLYGGAVPERFHTPTGSYELTRPGIAARSPLRAFDAADEYLVQHVHEAGGPGDRPLVINDGFGALALAWHHSLPISWSDSYLAHDALRVNLTRNQLAVDAVATLPSTAAPSGPVGLAVVKIPKAAALLEAQLRALRPRLVAGSRVLGAAMTRHVHSATVACFERVIGPTRTSRARKKARLIMSEFDPELQLAPFADVVTYRLDEPPLRMHAHAGVFSRRRLDNGSRFLLQHFPDCRHARTIVDLGCGNGVLGCVAAWRAPSAAVHFADQSYRAIASARASFADGFPDQDERVSFTAGDCLQGVAAGSVDVVLCNPPFHQNHALATHVAHQMFRESAAALRAGGVLLVVANRHLPYSGVLRAHFAQVTQVAANRKFSILRALK